MQWIRAMWFRILFAISAMALIHYFPSPSDSSDEKIASGGRNIPTYYFLLVIASTVLASFASTVQFVGISAFHTIIADPAVGGTYMTVRPYTIFNSLSYETLTSPLFDLSSSSTHSQTWAAPGLVSSFFAGSTP